VLVLLLLHVSVKFYSHHQVAYRSIYVKYDLERGFRESLGNKFVTKAVYVICTLYNKYMWNLRSKSCTAVYHFPFHSSNQPDDGFIGRNMLLVI
jgi:hypothetical protein